MDFVCSNLSSASVDFQLYHALAVKDLPAAQLITAAFRKRSITQTNENPATAFNRGLCLFLLGEHESAISELKHAEKLLGNTPELDISDKNQFIKALEISSRRRKLFLLPLDPNSVNSNMRYVLIRIKWLTAVCLKALGRDGEAAMIERFLSQYNIEL